MIEMALLKQEVESLRKNERETKFEVNKVSQENKILSQTVEYLTKGFDDQRRKLESYGKTIELLNLELKDKNFVREKKSETDFVFDKQSIQQKEVHISKLKRGSESFKAKVNAFDINESKSETLFDQSSLKRTLNVNEFSSMPNESF